ncbi:N-formylglutamate amidohydrolase [soil metagenome]
MIKVIISCEHGGNEIPPDFAVLFTEATDLLNSHQGYDIGALQLAQVLAEKFADFFYSSTISRLLVDLNRSSYHSKVFSHLTKGLDKGSRQGLLDTHYLPYRSTMEDTITQCINLQQQVIHISVHSFTPILGTQVRNNDIGFLYDPKSLQEKYFCNLWKKYIQSQEIPTASCKVRHNYPYKGSADGFSTHLRKRFAGGHYLGIELEVNQRLFTSEADRGAIVIKRLVQGLQQALEDVKEDFL